MSPAAFAPLLHILPLTFLTLMTLAFAMRRWNVFHDFRTTGLSCFIGTGAILAYFTLWTLEVAGPIDAFADGARALAFIDCAAGAGAGTTWAFMSWQTRHEIKGATDEEARDV